MELADHRLNPQAEALEEAQTRIRILIRDGYLANDNKAIINARVQEVVRDTLNQIKLRELREAAYKSLNAFAERQYMTYVREFGMSPIYLLAIIAMSQNAPGTPKFERAVEDISPYTPTPLSTFESDEVGVATQTYSRNYFRDYVVPAFDKILAQKALDPDDISGTNSLRNRAEMEVRYARHIEEIDALRAAGVKLVTSSVHADCSNRCYEWQGRVYSLDGTSGTTEDGKHYVPLETATDVYYTTKAGKTYKNGLFGFNCRHYLMVYNPHMVIPHVSAERQRKERAINIRQRELERRVREQREKALIFKKVDRELYLKARTRAIEANKDYIKFSQDNGRAYYPSRTKLL